MIETVINIRNWDRVRNNLRATVAFHKDGLDPVARKWAQKTRRVLVAEPYAPFAGIGQPRRTYQMKRRWAVERVEPSHYKIINRAENRGFNYPILVVGQRQRAYNRHWWLFTDIVQRELPSLRNDIDKELKNLERE